MMRRQDRTITRMAGAICVAALVGVAASTTFARAESPREIAERISPSVWEVIVGGQWNEAGKEEGAYRAILIYRVIDSMPFADIILQWIDVEDDGSLRVVASETVTSLKGEPADTAFIALDYGEDSSEPTRLLIGTYDRTTGEDDIRFVRLGAPARFEFMPTPNESEEAESEDEKSESAKEESETGE